MVRIFHNQALMVLKLGDDGKMGVGPDLVMQDQADVW